MAWKYSRLILGHAEGTVVALLDTGDGHAAHWSENMVMARVASLKAQGLDVPAALSDAARDLANWRLAQAAQATIVQDWSK